MISPYHLRLVSLSLACFYLLHFAFGLVAILLAPRAIRRAERMRPGAAAALVLGLRLFPAVWAAVAVAALCVPSYLRLEPEAPEEEIGVFCLVAAMLGLAVMAAAAGRAAWAIGQSLITHRSPATPLPEELRNIRGNRSLTVTAQKRAETSRRLPDRCKNVAHVPSRDGNGAVLRHFHDSSGSGRLRVQIVESPGAIFRLAGIFRPRIVVSRDVWEALSGEQRAAALRHEQAHMAAHDNLKRLVLMLAPGLFPGVRGFNALEQAWARFAERSADEAAAGGDPVRSVELAGALLRVARLGLTPSPSPLVASFSGGDDLSRRVERLLGAATRPQPPPLTGWMPALAACLPAALLLLPGRFSIVHELLEGLITNFDLW